ncbi:MAG: CatA-like O-acetyltransferase [Clostridiales bacterium]|nr:CatA-like O-acetyltransferase [Clostridiales bacterium]
MKIIDIENWNRKVIYNNFIGYSNPIFSISSRLDVTQLYDYCKNKGISFFTAFTFIAGKCLNGVEEFRLRLKDGKVVLYDRIRPSFIVKRADGVISTCRTGFCESFKEYYPAARAAQKAAQENTGVVFNGDDCNDLFFITCMPWVDIYSFSNPYDLKNPDMSSIPRLMWSKFVPENGRLKMTFDIAAHHALIDGEPVCRAINLIQNALCSVEEFLNN